MSMIQTVKKFLKLSMQEKILLCEAFFYLIIAVILVQNLPFRKIASRLGKHMKKTPSDLQSLPEELLEKIKRSLKRAQLYVPRGENCLIQGIAGKIMLKRHELPSTLYLGLAKDSEENAGFKAHAWLRCGHVILIGKEGSETFTEISYFG